jgi:CRISPR/Cas system CMR-associated protein Cmr3 (group 5 of RAMP superfamily)
MLKAGKDIIFNPFFPVKPRQNVVTCFLGKQHRMAGLEHPDCLTLPVNFPPSLKGVAFYKFYSVISRFFFAFGAGNLGRLSEKITGGNVK